MLINHAYIEDTMRELFDELHDYLVEDFVQNIPEKDRDNIRKLREKHRPHLGSFTTYDIKLLDDFTPKLFDTYDGDAPIKDILREHIEILYQFRMIHSSHCLHNSLRYEIAPKLGKKKSREENIDSFKKKIQDIFDLMGGDTYPRTKDINIFIQELQKAYSNADMYMPSEKIKTPRLINGIKDWLTSLNLTNKTDIIKEYTKSIKA